MPSPPKQDGVEPSMENPRRRCSACSGKVAQTLTGGTPLWQAAPLGVTALRHLGQRKHCSSGSSAVLRAVLIG